MHRPFERVFDADIHLASTWNKCYATSCSFPLLNQNKLTGRNPEMPLALCAQDVPFSNPKAVGKHVHGPRLVIRCWYALQLT